MQGYQKYRSVQNTTRGARDTEYRLLGQVTGALMRARDENLTLQERISAVLWNDRVWNAFLCDLSQPGNRLPDQIKQNLIKLAVWVAKETQRFLDNQTTLDGFISINRQIMAGLAPKSEARPPSAAAAQPSALPDAVAAA